MCSNIACALQASDIINHFRNRYEITLSAGSIFCKMSTAHVFSIIEALLFVAVNSYHEQCCNTDGSVCNRVGKCDLYIKKANNYSFANLVSLLNKLGVVPLADRQHAQLTELKGIRDRIHIWDAEGNELLDIEFTRSHYNKAIKMLAQVRDCLI